MSEDDIGCTGELDDCAPDAVVRSLTLGVSLGFVLYFIGTLYYFRQGYAALRDKQYLNYRISNIMIRLQVKTALFCQTRTEFLVQFRLQMIVHSFHLCSMACLWFSDVTSCASFVLSWLGFLPSQFSMTVVEVVKCYLFMPLKPTEEDFTLQACISLRNTMTACCLDVAEGVFLVRRRSARSVKQERGWLLHIRGTDVLL